MQVAGGKYVITFNGEIYNYKTNHTVFSLSIEDLYKHIDSIVDYIDEPFADSSAILVNILTKETRKK